MIYDKYNNPINNPNNFLVSLNKNPDYEVVFENWTRLELIDIIKSIDPRRRYLGSSTKAQLVIVCKYVINEYRNILKQKNKILDNKIEIIADNIQVDKMNKADTGDSLVDVIINNIKPKLSKDIEDKIDKEFASDTIKERVKKTILELSPRPIEVTYKENKTILEKQHKTFDKLLKYVSSKVNTYLVGPAGSGKTKAAYEVAKALKLPFYSMSVGPMTTQTQVVGYMDAVGKYVPTPFRKAFEEGGIFLFDEIDSANSNVLTCINQSTSSDISSFPDNMVKKHADFICIAAANTYGRGADRIYVGRNQLDGATLDRFCTLIWDIDEVLEEQIATNSKWTKKVQKIRKVIDNEKIRHVVSPRASIYGSALLASGLSETDVEEAVIWKGLDHAIISKIKSKL